MDEPTGDRDEPTDRTEFDHFRELLRKVVAVPKKHMDDMRDPNGKPESNGKRSAKPSRSAERT